MSIELKGAFTALITPFKGEYVDFDALCKFIEWQIDEGIHGLVSCGTTGEYPTLSYEEYCSVVKLCVQTAKKRVPVIAGTGSNCTFDAVNRTKFAESIGADAALVVAPYYNKPSQECLYAHFRTIHDHTNIPIVLYNVPGRCIVDVSDEISSRLMELPRIIGIKDATGDLNRPISLKNKVSKDIALLSGEDSTALIFNMQGGCGCISVAANVVPRMCAELQNLFFAKKYDDAIVLNRKLFDLNQVLFCTSNPIPVKYALSLINKNISPKLRLPLVELSGEHCERISKALKDLGILD